MARSSSAEKRRSISSGSGSAAQAAGAGSPASASGQTYTRPAPACKAALAASQAAPVMAVPRVALHSPPITATSPKQPLWLA
jgi:hypothetical protein